MIRFRQRKAFTIIEMVIVIAVIAILATVLVPTISGVIQKANHSTDVQFAANLNVQLAMYAVDKPIKNESDLRDAINFFYGEWTDETKTVLTQDGDFYAKLAPKSAKQGYHYWWDAANSVVVLSTYEKLIDTNGDGVVVTAEGDPIERTFSPASPRNLILATEEGEKEYFLMDQEGSEVAEALKLLGNCNEGNYITALYSLENMEDAEGAVILAKVQDTAILNGHGMFVCGTDTVSYIFIPEGTRSLNAPAVSVYANGTLTSGSLTFDDILSDDTLIDVPAGIKLYTRGAAFGEGITIFMNATLEEIKANGLIHAESTNCTIKLPDGNEYTVSGKNLMQDGSAVYTSLPYTVPVSYVTVTLNNSFTAGNVKANITQNKLSSTNDGQLYIAYDYAGDLGFIFEAFDASGNPIPDAVTVSDSYAGWTKGADKYTTTAGHNGAIGTLTVTVQGEDYTVNVKNVGIQSLVINDFGGITASDFSGTGYTWEDTFLLAYTNSLKSYQVSYKVTPELKKEITGIDVDETVYMYDDEENSFVSYTDGNLNVTISNTNKTTNIQFYCGNSDSQVCKLNLVDNSNTPFAVSANANVSGYKNGENTAMVYSIGTKGVALTLGHLFDYNTGITYTDIEGQAITYSISVNDWVSPKFAVTSDWKSQTIDLSKVTSGYNNTKITITISLVSGASQSVEVMVRYGAYNVVNDSGASWLAAGDEKNIVLLENITIPNVSKQAFATGTSSATYSKWLKDAEIFGNFKQISFGTYTVSTKNSANYFIGIEDGKIHDLLIEGPKYSNVDFYTSNDNAMYVNGVHTTGTATIDNCYIAGFRSPVRVNGGSPTINYSTLKGGSMANMYVYKAGTITFTNSNTVQYKEGGVLGAGIFLDQDATNVAISTTNLKQYNVYTTGEINAIVDSVCGSTIGILIDISDQMSLFSNVKRTSTGDYHLGVMVWNEADEKAGVSITCSKKGTWHFLGDHTACTKTVTADWSSASVSGSVSNYTKTQEYEFAYNSLGQNIGRRFYVFGDKTFNETLYSSTNAYDATDFRDWRS